MKNSEELGRYIKRLREKRELSQEELADKLDVTKSLISHIENERPASKEILQKLIEELNLTLKEREELQQLCSARGISIGLREGTELSLLNSVDSEFEDQQHFRKVFVVARRPIELSDISERNPLLTQLAAEFSSPKQNKSRRKPNKTPSRAYTYFTHESSVSDFSVFFSFLEKHGVKREVIKATFKIVLSPEELGLLPFAIYADPTRTNAHFQYDVAGRILLRDRDEVSSFRVVRMADLEVTRTYQFLRRILEALEINQRSKRGYVVLPWEQILV